MGYVSNIVLFLLFFVAVFQGSIFLAEDVIFPSHDVAPESTDSPVLSDITVESSHPVSNQANIADGSAESIQEQSVSSSSADVLASLPDLTFPQPSRISASSAFHPPLVDDFWTVFLHQLNYFQPIKASPREDVAAATPVPIVPAATTDGVKTVEEDMPPFEEWRQQRLQDVAKEKSDQAVANHTGKRRQRPVKNTNYASVICGAKVTAHNAELENAGAILTANRDDYMLNPCKAARKYFVVELCESIHVHGFDIGNMELFSNVPRSIQVFGSARYPSRDWSDYGKFELKEARTMQNFEVPATATGFVKFIRVEMLEHYGKEHYCPITVFRVFGTSMVEEYVDSVDDDEADAQTSLDGGDAASPNEDADIERDKWGQGLTESQNHVNPITMAKDLVVSFMKKAASSGYNLINGASQNSTPAPCRNTTAVISSLRSNSTEPHNSTHSTSDIAPNSPLLSLCFDDVEGWDVATVTCQYVWCLFQASNASLSFCPGTGNSTKIHGLPACDPEPDDQAEVSVQTEHARSIPVAHETAAPNVSEEVLPVAKVIPQGPLEEIPTTVDPKASKFITVNEKEQQRSFPAGVLLGVEKEKSGKSEDSLAPENGKPPGKIVNATVTTAVPVPSMTSGGPGQKESVFVRLGNRLKTLELNMSLSGQYLHELSRRFKRQGDDSAKNFTVVFSKLQELARKDTDLLSAALSRLRELEQRNHHFETLTTSLQNEVKFLRWIVPILCAISIVLVLISVAVGITWLPRYIRGLVVQEAHRQHAHGQTNGHVAVPNGKLPNGFLALNGPISGNDGELSGILKKKHKKRKRSHAAMEGLLLPRDDHSRLVPE